MKKEEMTRLRIDQLKEKKHDIEFEIGKLLDYFLGLLVFLAVATIISLNYIQDSRLKITAMFFFLVIVLLASLVFKAWLSKTECKRELEIRELELEYKKILKK